MNLKTTIQDDVDGSTQKLIPLIVEKVLHWNEDLQAESGKALATSISLLPQSVDKSLYEVTLKILQSRTSNSCHMEWASIY